MKQIIQDLKKGNTLLEEVPAPRVKPGSVLIKTTRSLVSLGTERMFVEFGKASLVANGSKAYSKERIEAYSQGKTLIVDNWRMLKGYGVKGFGKLKTRLDKEHRNQFSLLVESVKSGQPIIPYDEIVNTTKASFAAIQSLKKGRWVEV